MPDRSTEWATVLLDYRRTRGLKQAAAAADLGVSQGTISRWESGVSQPTPAMRRLLSRTALADRAPLCSSPWVETFRRMLVPGLVISSDHVVVAVTPALCRHLGVAPGQLEGRPLAEAFEGEALEVEAELARREVYQGRVASFEASHRLDLARRVRPGAHVFLHYVGWPHQAGDGRISAVAQGLVIAPDKSAEVRARLGGPLSITPAGC